MNEAYRNAMDEIQLSPEADARIRKEIFCAQALRKKKPARKTMLRTAVAVAAVLLLAATVYAAGAQIYMKITRTQGDQVSVTFEETATTETEPLFVIATDNESESELTVYEAQYQFPREATGAYVELGYWLPEYIPAGYEQTFVSDRAYDSQTILYGNEAGNEIRFKYTKPSGFGGVTMYGVVSEETVQIGDGEGVLFQYTCGGSLFWTLESKGIGFWLSVDDPEVDLVEMAQSVTACEPFRSEQADADTAAALEQLGDFSPVWLPDGFEMHETVGIPVPEDGWYGYIRKFYTDYTTNRELNLSYEPFTIPEDVAEDDPDAYFVRIQTAEKRADVVTEEITVNGMTGVIRINPYSNAVHWLDTERNLMFCVASATVTVEELVQLAENVE